MVSISRWPPESSSSSRSPSARSPSGPGLSALMNIEVIEHGPEISIPGFFSSSGTGGTFQSPVVASLAGSGEQPRAVGAQLQRARVQAIVKRGQELVEGRREQMVGALDGLESYA